MPKNIENINPIHEDVHEDEARIFKNDPEHTFVPIDQVPDPEDHDPFKKEEELHEDEGVTNEEYQAHDIELSDWEDRRREQLSQDIRIAASDGAVSIGPDVEGALLEEAHIDNHKQTEGMVVGIGLDSMSHERVAPNGYESKKELRRAFGSDGKQNMKTMGTEKKQRSFRGLIRKFLGRDKGGVAA